MHALQDRTAPRRPAGNSEPIADALGSYLDAIGRHDLLTADEEVELAQTIEAGRHAEAALERSDYDGPEDAARLRSAAAAGKAAADRFVSANLRLVVANARRYARHSGMDMLDLVQEGNLGLLRAVDKFDWRKGFKFSTYATWWIRQAITRALAEKSRVVRLPGTLHDVIGTVRAAEAALRAATGRAPSIDDIAEETGVPVEQVQRAMVVADTASLEQPVGEDGALLGDFVEDGDAPDPGRRVEAQAVSDDLRTAVGRLPAREQRILTMRYGFIDGIPRTLDEIGDEFGLTRERIRQIEKLALCRLRHPTFGLNEANLV